jgi:hypothetical protein
LLAVCIRTWLLCHTEVMARDGVGFVRYAWELRTQPWKGVLRGAAHPPGYPLAILLVSRCVEPFWCGSLTGMMQLSAQLASALASIVLILPAYYLGKRLFDGHVAFWSVVFIQCLPAASRVMSDSLSEAVFLMFLTTSLYLATRAFDKTSPLYFGLTGLIGALAYLARPEGALVIAVTGCILLAAQCWRSSRRPLTSLAASIGFLVLGAALVAGPYIAVIGHVTNKTTGIDVLRASLRWATELGPRATCTGSPRPGPWLLSSVIGVYWADIKNCPPIERLWCSFWAVWVEIVKGTHYIGWLPGILGVYVCRKRFREGPAAWLLPALCFMHGLLLWRVAYVAGYVADRHVLVFLVCGSYWAVATVFAFGGAVASGMRWLGGCLGWSLAGHALEHDRRPWAIGLAMIALLSLPKTLEPLHTNRAGYHAAGLWLAQHATAADQIIDPFSWAEYYSGRTLQEQLPGRVGSVPVQFVVLGCSDNEHVRLPLIPYAETLASCGTVVYQWPPSPQKRKAEPVAVYRVEPEAAHAAAGRLRQVLQLTAREVK